MIEIDDPSLVLASKLGASALARGIMIATAESCTGGLVAGGISNLYYPPKDRGAGLVFEDEGIGIAGTAVTNLIQEFIIPKLTPNLPNHRTAQPAAQP